jgi:hypothetical protein
MPLHPSSRSLDACEAASDDKMRARVQAHKVTPPAETGREVRSPLGHLAERQTGERQRGSQHQPGRPVDVPADDPVHADRLARQQADAHPVSPLPARMLKAGKYPARISRMSPVQLPPFPHDHSRSQIGRTNPLLASVRPERDRMSRPVSVQARWPVTVILPGPASTGG